MFQRTYFKTSTLHYLPGCCFVTCMGDRGLEMFLSGRMVEHGLEDGKLSASRTIWMKMTAAFMNLYWKMATMEISLFFTFTGHNPRYHPGSIKAERKETEQVKAFLNLAIIFILSSPCSYLLGFCFYIQLCLY